jgi:hypothetical protein
MAVPASRARPIQPQPMYLPAPGSAQPWETQPMKLHQRKEVSEQEAVGILMDMGKLSMNDLRQLDLCLNNKRRWTPYLEGKVLLIQLLQASPITDSLH